MTRVSDQDGDEQLWAAHEDDDYVELPPERGALPKLALAVVLVLTVVAVVGFGVRRWYQQQVDPSGAPGAAVAVDIPRGTTITGAGGLLADKGVISNPTVFRFWVRGKDVSVQAGHYRFRRRSSFEEVLAALQKGPAPPPVTRITVPEGLTLREIGARLAEEGRFDRAAVDAALADPALRSRYQPAGQASLEGLLFPATYEVPRRQSAAELAARMVREMEAVALRAGIDSGVQAGADGAPSLSPYQVLIVASLIQEESGNPAEAPKIARVIYNRLDQGIPLGIDATSRYLAEQTGADVDFESESPYNTRRQAGLPPTPIAAPGAEAIEAALHPADGPWIYYVLEAEGRHFFTASEQEFIAKKRECEQKGLGCG